ncbi:MAG: carboxylesterase family protein [Oscillospiraceae bacterium]|nr:carboxylesterase family protein [Oscillospiraceae bacterium]
MNYVERKTDCGVIRGLETESCLEFRGIRYARAERFRYPEPVTGWEGVYDATEFRECAYQHRAFDDDAKVNAFYHKEFRKGLTFTYGEDCLFLNIWAPKTTENCPVIIYIHGGSFTGGSGNEGHIRGTHFAENGVILVTFNYRLGPFGFCSHPDVKSENGACGNFGLFDQTAAIRWVKDNISAFGGDPDRITLMGQSAGAMSVDIHLSNSLCKDCFSGAVMMSGAGMQRFAAKPLTPEKTVPFWDVIMANAKVSTMEELRHVDAKVLYYAWLDACKTVKSSMRYTFPVYDGVLLRQSEFKAKSIPDIPYVIGMTSKDMIPAALQVIIKKWAKTALKNNTNKCYLYNFTRALPGDTKGAWHSSDLLYAFDTLDFSWRPFEKIDHTISKQLLNALCAFAQNGDPNCEYIPQWNADIKKPMRFCENTRSVKWDTVNNIRNMATGMGIPV